MNIRIDRMTLHLPSGFEHRAASIARLTAENLSLDAASPRRTLRHLRVESSEPPAALGDRRIAESIAQRIGNAYKRSE